MNLKEIIKITAAEVLTGAADIETEAVYSSDLVSEMLLVKDFNALLVTSLLTPQTLRAAKIIDAAAVLFTCGKKPNEDMITVAEKEQLTVLVSDKTNYEICGMLYAKGLKSGK